MFVIINDNEYKENDIVCYDDCYGHIKGIIKYGIWNQDGSGGEYPNIPCYGWYVEFLDIVPYEGSNETKQEVLEYYPIYLKHQSLLSLIELYNITLSREDKDEL